MLDHQNNTISFNNSFLTTFPEFKQIKCENADILVDFLKNHIENTEENHQLIQAIAEPSSEFVSGELNLLGYQKKCFLVNIQPILLENEELMGRIVSFNDISDYKNAVAELLVIKERNRMARDIHDTLGHSMTLMIALLETSNLVFDKDSAKAREKLVEAIKVAKEGLGDLRRSVSGLVPRKLEMDNLLESLYGLFQDFQSSGIKIDLTVEGTVFYENPVYSDVIYRVCQEALTNSLRHGKASNVNIILSFKDGWVKLFIFDDGSGCNNIRKGFGLSGMEQRIRALNGDLIYGTSETGFNIIAELPMENTPKIIRVVLVEDQVALRETFSYIIEQDSYIKVVGMAGDGKTALDLCGQLLPDLVLMDLVMPECDGAEGTRLIKTNHPAIKILILTSFDDHENIARALKNGADGYILKDIAPSELIMSIKSTAGGLSTVHQNIYHTIVKQYNPDDGMVKSNLHSNFTGQELTILRMVAEGKTNQEISSAVHLSEGRIKNIITGVMNDLGLENRTQSVIITLLSNICL